MRVFKSLSLSIPYVLALGGAGGLSTFPSPPSAQAATVQPLSNTCAPLLSALAQARPDAESLSGLSARLKDA